MLERPGTSISGTPNHNRGISSSNEKVATPIRCNPTTPDDLCRKLRPIQKGSVHDDGIHQLLAAYSTDSAPNHLGKQRQGRFRPNPNHDKKIRKQPPETLERLKDNQKPPIQRSRQKIRMTPLVKKKTQEKEITNQQRIFLTHQNP